MVEPPTRIQRLRARADRMSAHYEELAQRRPLFGLPFVLVTRYTARQGMLLASAVAFRLFLWLLPLALLLAGAFAGLAGVDKDLADTPSAVGGVTGQARQQIATALRDGHRSWWIAMLVGLFAFLWTTRTLMQNLIVGNAHAWQVPARKVRQHDLLVSTVSFAGAWLLLLALAGGVSRLDHAVVGGVFVAIVIQAGCSAALWLLISLRLPDGRQHWTDLIPGSVVFGVCIAVLNAISRVYLPHKIEQSSELYGSLGVAASMLAWLLLFGQVIIGSALINSVVLDYRKDRQARRAAT